jgi:hypothetical protein
LPITAADEKRRQFQQRFQLPAKKIC